MCVVSVSPLRKKATNIQNTDHSVRSGGMRIKLKTYIVKFTSRYTSGSYTGSSPSFLNVATYTGRPLARPSRDSRRCVRPSSFILKNIFPAATGSGRPPSRLVKKSASLENKRRNFEFTISFKLLKHIADQGFYYFIFQRQNVLVKKLAYLLRDSYTAWGWYTRTCRF